MSGTSNEQPFRMRRVTALIGPYGSGKSELAIGLATQAARALTGHPEWTRVALADLDVLKPYFRSREAGQRLRESDVDLIAPAGALALADLPIIPAEVRGALARSDRMVLLDVGGDPVGARALGSLSDLMRAADHDLLLVLNRNRPFMETLAGVIAQARQISTAAQLPITGVVSNTHFLEETTLEDVFGGLDLARQVAAALGVEVRLLGVPEHLAGELGEQPHLPPRMVIRRLMKPEFLGGVVLAPSSPPQPLTGSRP